MKKYYILYYLKPSRVHYEKFDTETEMMATRERVKGAGYRVVEYGLISGGSR